MGLGGLSLRSWIGFGRVCVFFNNCGWISWPLDCLYVGEINGQMWGTVFIGRECKVVESS